MKNELNSQIERESQKYFYESDFSNNKLFEKIFDRFCDYELNPINFPMLICDNIFPLLSFDDENTEPEFINFIFPINRKANIAKFYDSLNLCINKFNEKTSSSMSNFFIDQDDNLLKSMAELRKYLKTLDKLSNEEISFELIVTNEQLGDLDPNHYENSDNFGFVYLIVKNLFDQDTPVVKLILEIDGQTKKYSLFDFYPSDEIVQYAFFEIWKKLRPELGVETFQ